MEKPRFERRGKIEHENALNDYIQKVRRNNSSKIIDLAGKSPDAIEVNYDNGELHIIAIEVLPVRWNKNYNTWKATFTHKHKKESYRMFDEVKIITYKLEYTK